MSIKLKYNITDRAICISTKHDTFIELKVIERLYFKILREVFLNKSLLLITRQPQKYSFGEGLANKYFLRFGKETLMVNKIDTANELLLESISQEEEFKRGLLILIYSIRDLIDSELKMALENIMSGNSKLNSSLKLVICEDDGDTFCLFNSDYKIHEMNPLLSEVLLYQ